MKIRSLIVLLSLLWGAVACSQSEGNGVPAAAEEPVVVTVFQSPT